MDTSTSKLRKFEKQRVLVVEDHIDTASLLKTVLETGDFLVRTAATCVEARDIRTLFDLYVLDYHLPDGSGLDLIRQIRRHDAHVPIIFLSAEADLPIYRRALEIGAHHYLRKPVDIFVLLSVARQLTANARIRGFQAAVEERTAILDELTERATAVSQSLDAAQQRIHRALVRRVGREAFVRAGGTLVDFSRFWRAA